MRISTEPPADTSAEVWRVRRATLAGLVVFALVGVLLWGWMTITGRRQAAEAVRALDVGNLPLAEVLIGSLRRANPDSAEVPYLEARLAWARKQPEEVLTHLDEARRRGYDQAPMQRLLGLLYASSGRRAEAEPLLRESWEGSSRADGEVADVLCRLYFESYRLRPALAVAQEWARRAPKDLRPLLWQGEIHTRDGVAPDVQIETFDAILARDPQQHRSRLGRASALRQVGRLDEARSDYEIYRKARPDDPEGHIGAARTAEGLDDEDEALAEYSRVLELDPESVVGLIGKASILIRRNKPAEALPLLDRAIAREPNDPEPHYRRGLALDRLGRRDEARAAFARRVQLQKEQEQIERIRKGIVRDPNNVALMADAASWLLGHGYNTEGLDWAEKALAKDPRHAPTLRLLADYYARKGDPGRANFYRLQIPSAAQAPGAKSAPGA